MLALDKKFPMNKKIIAVLDANVLYSFYLRDFFMRLAIQEELFHIKWTSEINKEWTRNLIKNRPRIDPKDLEETVRWMNIIAPDALIDMAPPTSMIASDHLPDKDDAHVIEAALIAKASYIITKNLKDFPVQILSPFKIEAIHPDDFLMLFIPKFQTKIMASISNMSAQYKNPKMNLKEIINALKIEIPMTCLKLEEIIIQRDENGK